MTIGRKLVLALLTLLLAGISFGAAEPYIVGGDVPSGSRDLPEAVKEQGRGVVWLAYSVPLVEDAGGVCCSHSGRYHRGRGRACTLEGPRWGMTISSENKRLPGEELVVYLRVEDGAVDRIRAYTSDCVVDGGDQELLVLGDVESEESVSFLESLLEDQGRRGDEALAALALHESQSATAALERIVDLDRHHPLQEEAIFWLGSMRGEEGYQALLRLIERGPDPDLHSEIAFALSESSAPGALDSLIQLYETGKNSDGRGEVLFWLAQVDDERATRAVLQAVSSDPSHEVREEAVFAVSQLPEGRGTEELLRIVRSRSYSLEVRQQALFWLAQSDDPRGADLLVELINR